MDVSSIVVQGSPVLCVDTCSLLDIMRDPTRDTARPHERQAAIDLVELAEAGELTCLIAEQVKTEFHEHDQAIQNEAEIKLKKLSEQVRRVGDITSVFGSTKTLDLTHLDDHVPKARKVVQRWLDQLQIVAPGDDAHRRAFSRVNRNQAPAKRGKESSKDCLIYETYLEAMSLIRAQGFASKIVFVSSNTADYCDNRTVLKNEIATEFGGLSIDYAPNMAAAKYALGFTNNQHTQKA
ncbi:PIN domain-containing protein [uncultured Tateyamaria sp.]|uniref:PIN domain-containing protein n=1 Tax=uncultured Tateyamaria sp. TaxID=455651 RepID=UPI002634B08D|nr:PIN domain-containing protein [uncultured Tateyamaria sp.]